MSLCLAQNGCTLPATGSLSIPFYTIRLVSESASPEFNSYLLSVSDARGTTCPGLGIS